MEEGPGMVVWQWWRGKSADRRGRLAEPFAQIQRPHHHPTSSIEEEGFGWAFRGALARGKAPI